MPRTVPAHLTELATRLEAEDDALLSRVDLSLAITDADLDTVRVSAALGVLTAELHAYCRTGDNTRLRELADLVSEWAGECVGYTIADDPQLN